jgi:hypothetical protein
VGKTEKVPAKLVTLSSVLEDKRVGVIDLLKIDVEGAEMAVLEGLRSEHWRLVQQVALEVENAETVRRICTLLEAKGFETYSFFSERERNPGVQSEVSMVYGCRPEYKKDALAARAKVLAK